MSLSKKAQQRLHFLRRLKRASLPPPILTTFYRGTIESVLTSCITVWYGNCSAADRKTLQRTVNTAAKIIGAPLPSILDIFLARCSSKPTASWRTPPTPPTVSFSSYHQEDGTGASEPLRQTAQQLFPPGCESPELRSPRPPSETPCKPYLMKHGPPPPPPPPPPPQTPPPQPHLIKEKTVNFFCAIQVCYTQVSGPVQTTCSNTLSSMH